MTAERSSSVDHHLIRVRRRNVLDDAAVGRPPCNAPRSYVQDVKNNVAEFGNTVSVEEICGKGCAQRVLRICGDTAVVTDVDCVAGFEPAGWNRDGSKRRCEICAPTSLSILRHHVHAVTFARKRRASEIDLEGDREAATPILCLGTRNEGHRRLL